MISWRQNCSIFFWTICFFLLWYLHTLWMQQKHLQLKLRIQSNSFLHYLIFFSDPSKLQTHHKMKIKFRINFFLLFSYVFQGFLLVFHFSIKMFHLKYIQWFIFVFFSSFHYLKYHFSTTIGQTQINLWTQLKYFFFRTFYPWDFPRNLWVKAILCQVFSSPC